MKPALVRCSITCIVFLSLWTGSASECSSTVRVRKPWNSLSDTDQLLFAKGFQALHTTKVLDTFMMAHEKATSADSLNIHTTSQNLFWHSYWLWELESSFRQIGPEYECFTLPYWDVTHDAKVWAEMDGVKSVDRLPIYNSYLGGDGDWEKDRCVTDALWTKKYYSTSSLCADDEEPGDCCLKRFHVDNTSLATRTEVADAVFINKTFKNYGDFGKRLNDLHSQIHLFVGSVHHVHFNPKVGDQVADPLFPVFHSFLEYVRLLREDCYEFDKIEPSHLDEWMPYTFKEVNTSLDYEMDFSALCDPKDDRLCSRRTITPRLMYDLSVNSEFNVIYELGDFWNGNEALKSLCADNLNTTWWINLYDDGESATVRAGDRWFGTSGLVVLPASVLMVGVALIALLNALSLKWRSKKDWKRRAEAALRGEWAPNAAYGTV